MASEDWHPKFDHPNPEKEEASKSCPLWRTQVRELPGEQAVKGSKQIDAQS